MKCLECAINPLLHFLSGSASNQGSSFCLFQIACVFKARINAQFNGAGNLKGVADFFRNKLNYTHKKIGEKVQPHQPSVLMFYPTQMLKYLPFN